jgi:hypothetical protein
MKEGRESERVRKTTEREKIKKEKEGKRNLVLAQELQKG